MVAEPRTWGILTRLASRMMIEDNVVAIGNRFSAEVQVVRY